MADNLRHAQYGSDGVQIDDPQVKFPRIGAKLPLTGRRTSRVVKRFIDTVGVTLVNSGTAATVSIDAASPFGKPAYKVAMPAGNTYAEIQLTGLSTAAFDGHVLWKVWVEDYTAIKQIGTYAGIAGYGRLYQGVYRLNISNLNRWNGEHIIPVGPTAANAVSTFVAGTDTLSDTKLRISPEAAGANLWIEVCVIPEKSRANHILTYDDTSVTWVENVLPDLSEFGLVGNFGVSTGDLNGSPTLYLSSAQLQNIARAGHQISSHNVTNTALNDGTGGTQTPAQYTTDFAASIAALGNIVGQSLDPTYHPWVQGRNNQAAHDTMRAAGMKIGRGVDSGYNWPHLGFGNGILALKIQVVHTLSTAQIDAVCATAAKYGLTVVWMLHEVTQNGGAGVETSKAVHRHLCSAIRNQVDSELAYNPTLGEFCSEIYSLRLVPPSFI